jgi:hypothetical protein
MTESTDWSGFDTAGHHAAQAGCRHLIHCAVDANTRAAVSRNLDNARHTGDANAVVILLAQLAGPCCLPPVEQPEPGTVPPPSPATPAGRDVRPESAGPR